jgi:cob(I)alamin adenosyltransferase
MALPAEGYYISRMKIYTRTGDLGETGLFFGPRVGKDAPRLEVCGTVDELNAMLGLVRSGGVPDGLDPLLERFQNELFEFCAELATPDPVAHGTRTIGQGHVAALEADIDRLDAELPELKGFIVPGGTPAAAMLHVARAVCRDAERRLTTLVRQNPGSISLILMAYLNRLGDLLFVLARVANARAGRADVLWQKPQPGDRAKS